MDFRGYDEEILPPASQSEIREMLSRAFPKMEQPKENTVLEIETVATDSRKNSLSAMDLEILRAAADRARRKMI